MTPAIRTLVLSAWVLFGLLTLLLMVLNTSIAAVCFLICMFTSPFMALLAIDLYFERNPS